VKRWHALEPIGVTGWCLAGDPGYFRKVQ
jgi:hypothetical protein